MSNDFEKTYLGQLRAIVGSRMLQVPAVRAVVLDSLGRVLLHRRSDFGVWGLPGGHPEAGESLQDCVVREIFEETGLQARGPLEVYGYSSSGDIETTTYPNGHVVHSYTLLVLVRHWSGEPIRANEESLEVRFFAPNELPARILPNERRSLEAFCAWQQGGGFQLY